MDVARGHDLSGMVVVMTGGDYNIGYATALALAEANASLILGSYDSAVTHAAAANITRATGNAQIAVLPLDLSSLRSVRTFAAAVRARAPAVDRVICDAATHAPPGDRTEDGLDRTAQVCYLGHFLLVELLLPALRGSGGGRVIAVSSLDGCTRPEAPASYSSFPGPCRQGKLPDDCTDMAVLPRVVTGELNVTGDGASTYGLSKFMVAQWARELSRREAAGGSAVRAYSLRPGIVVSCTIGAPGCADEPTVERYCANPVIDFAPCPMRGAAGASTIVHLAVAPHIPEEDAGAFFYFCRPFDPPAWDPEARRRLFDLSLQWTAPPPPSPIGAL